MLCPVPAPRGVGAAVQPKGVVLDPARNHPAASEEDLLTLVYTSGTTGEPKGVMLTHANILFEKEVHDKRLIDPNENDISLRFLPLGHIFERCWTYYALATGMENNYLDDPAKIRIKDLMKTSGGKHIAPQLAESLLGADHFIEQVAVIGKNGKYVTALIVPSFEALKEHARAKNIGYALREDLIGKPEIEEFCRKRIDDATREFARFEKIKKFTLLPKDFTVEEGEITPTLKIRRKIVEEKYRHIIESMYEESPPL